MVSPVKMEILAVETRYTSLHKKVKKSTYKQLAFTLHLPKQPYCITLRRYHHHHCQHWHYNHYSVTITIVTFSSHPHRNTIFQDDFHHHHCNSHNSYPHHLHHYHHPPQLFTSLPSSSCSRSISAKRHRIHSLYNRTLPKVI